MRRHIRAWRRKEKKRRSWEEKRKKKKDVGVIYICQFSGGEKEIMLAIEGFMVARFMIAVAGEGCMVAAAGKGSKVVGEEKDWGFTTAIGEASKAKGEEVCTVGWYEESIGEEKIEF